MANSHVVRNHAFPLFLSGSNFEHQRRAANYRCERPQRRYFHARRRNKTLPEVPFFMVMTPLFKIIGTINIDMVGLLPVFVHGACGDRPGNTASTCCLTALKFPSGSSSRLSANNKLVSQ